MRIQMAIIPRDGSDPVVLAGDPNCNADPCAKHKRCHCMCPCGCDPEDDNCDDCAEMFGDEDDVAETNPNV